MTREEAKRVLAATTPFERVGPLVSVWDLSVIEVISEATKNSVQPYAFRASDRTAKMNPRGSGLPS